MWARWDGIRCGFQQFSRGDQALLYTKTFLSRSHEHRTKWKSLGHDAQHLQPENEILPPLPFFALKENAERNSKKLWASEFQQFSRGAQSGGLYCWMYVSPLFFLRLGFFLYFPEQVVSGSRLLRAPPGCAPIQQRRLRVPKPRTNRRPRNRESVTFRKNKNQSSTWRLRSTHGNALSSHCARYVSTQLVYGRLVYRLLLLAVSGD